MVIENFKIIFWDFDGVIKDSVKVKSEAFAELFLPFGGTISSRVKNHHEKNSGVSRYDKLPLYISWLGQAPTPKLVNYYEKKFSYLVKQKVINSKWTDGVLEYLTNNYKRQHFFLVTATPQNEIEEILISLNIMHYFQKVVGSPTKKTDAIMTILKNPSVTIKNSVMIGDSIGDYNAAKTNHVRFILKCTDLNNNLQKELDCTMLDNFL